MNSGVLLLITFSLLTGMGGYFVKLTQGISAQQILFARAVLACSFLFVVALSTKKIRDLKIRFPTATLVMGITQGLSIYFYYLALEKTTIANSTLLVYTAPIFSVILASLFLKEKIEKTTIWAIIVSFIGVFLVSNPLQLRLDSDQVSGSIYALLGGFFYSAMAISSKNVSEKTTPIYAAFWQYFIIAILTTFFVLPIEISTYKNNITSLLYLGLLAGGVAFLLYMEGVKRVKGQIIQVITMLEIIIASLSGYLLLREPISSNELIGGAFIVAAVLIVSRKKKKKTKKIKQ